MTIWLRSTTSTMKDASALAAEGEPHGTVVVAEEQTAGMGRHGQRWHSAPGGGLYLSIILRLEEPKPILMLALGLAAQRAVDDLTGVSTDLRWPNDLLLNDRKLAGIMVQAGEGGALIAGIGLNVNQAKFPEELQGLATSLLIETGKEHSREDLLERLVSECLRYTAIPAAEILRRFESASSYVRGKAVVVDNKVHGITAGLDENGFLLLQTDKGTETIVAGGVRPADTQG
ncbi:MAG: biotin--[acetyl-CoA-carboxylase] ligase [Acidobacteriota bacterium]|nr:biotin--[acetyl-CoA-carboxylase] ligase [Acidobacteriota bacterium]